MPLSETFPRQDLRARLFDDYRARGLWGTRTFDRVLEEGCTVKWPDGEFGSRAVVLDYRWSHTSGGKS